MWKDEERGEGGSAKSLVMEMEGGLAALFRARDGIWGLDFVPPELPGRESGGELEKSRARLSPGEEVVWWLPLREGKVDFLSSATR